MDIHTEMDRRICGRADGEGSDPARLTWELAHFHQLAAIQDENARGAIWIKRSTLSGAVRTNWREPSGD